MVVNWAHCRVYQTLPRFLYAVATALRAHTAAFRRSRELSQPPRVPRVLSVAALSKIDLLPSTLSAPLPLLAIFPSD